MSLYLVRHAKAGTRAQWVGPDEVRPLTAKGRHQADLLAARYAGIPVSRVLSSPYLRCVQTVEPLARQARRTVEPLDSLAEGRPFAPVLELLALLPDHAVLCSHGDLIPDVIAALQRRGTVVEGPVDWRKGVTWVLERDGESVVCARSVAPPEV
jgi:8-oxo-dGTP diphosphatase